MAARECIPLVVDDRERRGRLLPVLHASADFRIEIQRLRVGDYLLDDRFLFERKTLTDLVVSIQSGRLFKQALRLAEVQRLQPALILEGLARELETFGVRREAIQGALVTIELFVGLPVLRTNSPAETVRTFRYVTRQGRSVARGAADRALRERAGRGGGGRR